GPIVGAELAPILPVLFECGEEERLAGDDRSADAGPAELLTIARLRVLARARRVCRRPVGVGPAVGGESLVAELTVPAAAKRLRARAEREVEDAAAGAAVLCGHPARLDFEFLDRFHRRRRLADVSLDLNRRGGAVEQDFFGERRGARDVRRVVVAF